VNDGPLKLIAARFPTQISDEALSMSERLENRAAKSVSKGADKNRLASGRATFVPFLRIGWGLALRDRSA
jgi:hypothetical protein